MGFSSSDELLNALHGISPSLEPYLPELGTDLLRANTSQQQQIELVLQQWEAADPDDKPARWAEVTSLMERFAEGWRQDDNVNTAIGLLQAEQGEWQGMKDWFKNDSFTAQLIQQLQGIVTGDVEALPQSALEQSIRSIDLAIGGDLAGYEAAAGAEAAARGGLSGQVAERVAAQGRVLRTQARGDLEKWRLGVNQDMRARFTEIQARASSSLDAQLAFAQQNIAGLGQAIAAVEAGNMYIGSDITDLAYVWEAMKSSDEAQALFDFENPSTPGGFLDKFGRDLAELISTFFLGMGADYLTNREGGWLEGLGGAR
jgi:hypothetical protein